MGLPWLGTKDVDGDSMTKARQIAQWAEQRASGGTLAPADPTAIERRIAEIAAMPDTRPAAKALLRARALDLMERLIADAEPGEIIDLMERIEVVAPKQKNGGDSGVTVIVGGGGEVKIGVLTAPPAPDTNAEPR